MSVRMERNSRRFRKKKKEEKDNVKKRRIRKYMRVRLYSTSIKKKCTVCSRGMRHQHHENEEKEQ